MIKIQHLKKAYDDKVIFKDFNLEIEKNKITSIIGPSGCGKSTLLNILGGIEPIDEGKTEGIDKEVCAFVFQENRLIPWMNVYDNLAFVLKSYENKQTIDRKIQEVLKRVELIDNIYDYPEQLSGGMKRRVALARAFIYKSTLILMDEAFSGLDEELKHRLKIDFLKLWEKNKKTVIWVTHDLKEAQEISHTVYKMENRPVKITRVYTK